MTSNGIASVILAFVLALPFVSSPVGNQEGKASETNSKKKIESGSKVYVAPMEGGFDISLVAAIVKKQVPPRCRD